MNLSTKCNCCTKEDVCKNSENYKKAIQSILKTNVSDKNDGYLMLKDAKFIEISIKCPTFLAFQRLIKGEGV